MQHIKCLPHRKNISKGTSFARVGNVENVPVPYPWNAYHAFPTQDSVKGRFSKPLYVEEVFLLDPIDDMKHVYAFLIGMGEPQTVEFCPGER